MKNEQKVILELLGQVLFGVPFDESKYGENGIDWLAVYQEAHKQTIVPTIVEAIPETARRDVRYHLIEDACAFESAGYRVLLAHNEVSRVLRENDVPVVLIKGASSGAYYPKPYQRKYGDVDVFVGPKNYEKLKTVLLQNGYEIGQELPYEMSMYKDEVGFDIHQEVNGLPKGKVGEYIRREMADLVESAQIFNNYGCEIPVPTDFHHGMIQLMHTARHLVGFGAGLRQLCDWAAFVNHMGDAFVPMFKEKLEKSALWDLALVMSTACVTYMNMTPYAWIQGADPELVDRFMEDLMRKGSLVHTGDDDMDSVFIAETDQGGVGKKNMFSQMLSNIAGKVCYQWPFMKKWKILIPFGMFWMGIRYIFGVLTGSYKKTNIKETIQKANKRKALYQELGLLMEAEEE